MRDSRGFTFLWLILVVAVVVILMAFAFGVLDINNITNKGMYQTPASDKQVQDLSKLSSSDEVLSIESDLNNTNLNNLDQGLDQINQDSTFL